MDPANWPVEESFMSLGEHLKLCILVGRVLKTIYSPTGLKHATDEQLETLLADFDGWLNDLPEQLRYKGPESSHNAGECPSHSVHPLLLYPSYPPIPHRFPSEWN